MRTTMIFLASQLARVSSYLDTRSTSMLNDIIKTIIPVAQPMQTLQLTTRLSNRSWFGDEDDEEDPFAEVSVSSVIQL